MTRRWRLFPKYALLIISLVGSMLVASGAIGLYFSWRESEAHLVALQEEKAENAANRIEEYIKSIEHQLSWTALPRADADGDALEQRRIEYLKLQRQAPAITEVVWIDPQGREQLRISRLAMDSIGSGVDLSQDDKFRFVTAKGKPYYGPVYFRKGTEPYLAIAIPAGSGGGVTAAEVNLKFVWDVVSKIKIGETGIAYVVDQTGTLIAHPDISLVLKKSDLSALPQVAALRGNAADGAPVQARDSKGEEVLSANAPIKTLNWTVFVESPRAEAFAPLYATLQSMSLVLVAALLISIAASFFLARALVRPLRALQEGAAKIGAGDLDRHIAVSTGDELEGLAEQFNRMSAQLRESYAGLERKVEQRTAELSESLKQQTATSEVLKLISRSTFDLDAVLHTLLESAARLCGAQGGVLYRPDAAGNYLPVVVIGAGGPAGAERHRELLRSKPIRADEDSAAGRAVLHRATVHIDDVKLDPLYRRQDLVDNAPYRNVLAVPLLRAGEPIGVIALSNTLEGSSFTPGQIELVTTFADQAVIAIENARLFNETKEALEQQTATAEVLGVISGSVADSRPVFEKILESCQRLFASNEQGVLLVGEDGRLHLGAHHGSARERLEKLFPLPRAIGGDAANAERSVIHIKDVLGDTDVPRGLRAIAERIDVGTYSQVIAPMLWEGESIGSLYVIRQPPAGFTDKEIGLLRTFADQAVIAIQNSRLFNETKEALEQQTATAEVLQVISSSVADTGPVFDKILDSCERLFAATGLGIYLVDDEGLLRKAGFRSAREKPERALAGTFPRPLEGTATAVAIRERRVVHYDDVLAEPDVPAPLLRIAEAAGSFSIAFAPMLWEGRGVGAIQVSRDPPAPFSDKELTLLKTFADQAVIAIQNARLFNETKEALEQQTATAEVLQVISSSVADTKPVFDKILDSCTRLFSATALGIYVIDEAGMLQRGAFRAAHAGSLWSPPPGSSPTNPGWIKIDDGAVKTPLEGSTTEIAIREQRVVHFADVLSDPKAPAALRFIASTGGNFSIAFAPMLWEGRGVGAIQVVRDPPSPFSAKELTLLKTFADQAVIAIQNARLFNEIQAKSRELELANKHKSEFLANMSHELRTPLNAIIGFSEVLSEQMFGEVNEKQLEYLLDIHTSGHHLLSLINDILDLSKIEAGRMELDLASTNLPMLLDNCTTLVRERANRNGLVLALEVEDGIGDWVADVRKLKQVVINLLSNAVKFTPAGGRVTLRARKLEHAVEIAVVDTGVGIAADQQALVFEEFRQAGGDYLRKGEGTGLGLSLARRFVELHGGAIRVESAPGRGSTFAFILPERVVEAV
jgi:signal transduction histidine kinase